jgi:hypothetical protein
VGHKTDAFFSDLEPPLRPHATARAPADLDDGAWFEHAAASTPVAAVSDIEITYHLRDRFDADHRALPHVDHVFADIHGVIAGPEGAPVERVALGALKLGRLDLWDAGADYADVLDAHSGEWEGYIDVVDAAGPDLPRFLLIVDRVMIARWARGHAIGLHAAARAIRIWGDDALVVLTAFPFDGPSDTRHARAAALSRYWARLALDPVTGSNPPLLYGWANSDRMTSTLQALSAWQPPAPPVTPGVSRTRSLVPAR